MDSFKRDIPDIAESEIPLYRKQFITFASKYKSSEGMTGLVSICSTSC